ncbi:unnamed protein product [Rotaria sp. Silwood1]|nr:unnamed protein product [Rotaria sp. Silwood1]
MSQYRPPKPIDEPTYLFELIKHQYKRNGRIERLMNPSISFPIEQGYINLAILETQEQQQKEKKLRETQKNESIIGTFEEIYGIKNPIDIKDIFEKCKDTRKKVLVLGRAGIGKSTFSRYVTYRWAQGEIWSQYELVVLIPLRCLTEDRYPLGTDYCPFDIVKRQYFPYHDLSEEEKTLLKPQLSKNRVLWLLDGYDETFGNIPKHLEDLIKQLLNTTHHILTSRPYAITLPYDVKMEITGFTNDNIAKTYIYKFRFDNSDEHVHLTLQQIDRIAYLSALIANKNDFSSIPNQNGEYILKPPINYTSFMAILHSVTSEQPYILFHELPEDENILELL